MFQSRKESKVRDLAADHISHAEKCLAAAKGVFNSYLAGDFPAAEANAAKVEKHERAADTLRREIYELLGEGAFLPILRGDIHSLIGEVDDLAGLAEDLSDVLVGERPELPEAFREDLVKIFEITTSQFADLKNAVRDFLFDKKPDEKKLRKTIHRVSQQEYDIDQIEWELTRELFESEMPLANKLHFKQFLSHLTIISNRTEDVSDTLSELIIKLQV
jgi:predicted phosphate transport protein (TIGR00153 family)